MSRLSAVVLAALSLALASPWSLADEKRDHVCFRTLDADQDGRVTFQEFEEYYGSDPSPFKAADADQDGTLTHEEYHGLLGHGAN